MDTYEALMPILSVYTTASSDTITVCGATYEWPKLAYRYTTSVHTVTVLHNNCTRYLYRAMHTLVGAFDVVHLHIGDEPPSAYIYTMLDDKGRVRAKYIITVGRFTLTVLSAGEPLPIHDIILDYGCYVRACPYSPRTAPLCSKLFVVRGLTTIIKGLADIHGVMPVLLSRVVTDILLQD